MIPVIVINLKQETARRASMAAQLEALKIPFRFFDAIDGHSMSRKEIAALGARSNPRRYGAEMLPGELGCMASVLAVCKEIAEGPHPYGCLMEDDITLEPKIVKFLDETTLNGLPRFDVLRLYDPSQPFFTLACLENFTLSAPYRPTWSTNAQIITRAGAQKILKGVRRPQVPIDSMFYHDGFVKGLRVLEVSPPLSHLSALAEQTAIDPKNLRKLIAQRRTPLRMFWKKVYEFRARFRVLRNFVRLWGFTPLEWLQRRD